jgi:glucose uptake protein
MTLPLTDFSTLLVTLVGLVLLGSWINTLKLAGKWRFELYYYDFAIGAALAAAVAAFTLGTLGADGFTFQDDLMRAGKRNMAFAVAAGCVFNLGNMLLVGATTLMGMSVAFPLAMGLGLGVAAVVVYLNRPDANSIMLATGLALLMASVVFAVLSHRAASLSRELARMKAGEHRTLRPSVPWRGVVLCLASGVLLALHLPLVAMAGGGEAGVGPYALALLFAAGVAFSTLVYNLYFINLPVAAKPVEILDYFRGRFSKHLLGLLGGAAWSAGAVCWVVALSAPVEAAADRPLLFALINAAPLLAAAWGIIAWKELKGTDARSKAFLSLALFLYLAALIMLRLSGLAPAA